MHSLRRVGPGIWWMAWVLWCVPAGALAGVGLAEFNWGGPPYDGGFAGELMFFGGFLALGQAPFVAVFVIALYARGANAPGAGYAAGGLSALLWPPVGFVGWTAGSYLEVGLQAPLYSTAAVLAGVLPWLVVGALQGAVLVAALASVPRLRAGARVVCGAAWVLAGGVGGLFYEYWSSTEVAARENYLVNTIGLSLESSGVAENIAYTVVPNALFVPLLYGIPTGLALGAIRWVSPWRSA